MTVSWGHGRLMEPPSRASMWRLGYPNPADYNDNQGYCGGFQVRRMKIINIFFIIINIQLIIIIK